MDKKLKAKIGQMFIFGFSDSVINQDIYNLIDNYYLGNIILFSKNIEDRGQLVKLIEKLKFEIMRKTETIPFMAIDQEGGTVSRLVDIFGNHLGQYAIGALDDEELAFRYGADIGYKLKELGFNLNLAPVADINSNPENINIGIRSFSPNKEKVKRLVLAMAKGYESSYIIPVIKHFPGLGDTSIDSHFDLPVSYNSFDSIKNRELLPFEHAIKNDIMALLVSHIMFLDYDNVFPASMSKRFISNLLREDFGYKNIVIADCMEMGAIKNNYGVGDAVVIAINAGVDMFIVSSNYETQIKVIESVYNAIEEGIISESRINESYERIVHAKFKTMRNISKPLEIDFEATYIDVLKTNDFEKLNLDKEKTIAIAINQFVSSKSENVEKNPINICDIFEKYTGIKVIGFEKDITDVQIDGIEKVVEKYENVLLFVGDMDINKQQHALYGRMYSKNVYLFDMKVKVAKLFNKPKTYFAAYSYTNATVEILCNYLKDFM